ncbi:CidA/LrgA family protein [Lentibacillus sp. Marseille-P4043]|uniref:CidA/LrgA family protein n=1 Tax=Lentibacillus sp. Marseille-P4043 TaxID=2040293 RepID=UPI000D0BE595|nr:CidA/LrgA family protein [Lentibacillus sp. Marseille-P4043]
MKKWLTILLNISLIIAFTWIGKGIVAITHIPIPGSIIGMVLLFFGLQSGWIKLSWVEAGAALLISEMLLFFIPAVVGFMQYSWMFGIKGLVILFIVVSGTALMMISTGVISEKILARKSGEVRRWFPRYFI